MPGENTKRDSIPQKVPMPLIRKMRQNRLLKNGWFFVSLILLCLLIVQSYLSYKFPIKQDLYEHRFKNNQGNRIIAYAYLLTSHKKFEQYSAEQINDIIEETAKKYAVDPVLIKAIVLYESYYLSNAVSTTGAMGLMALMPGIASRFGVRDPFDPADNIDGGVRLVKFLSDTFQGDVSLILAGYNAGETKVKKYNGIPPYQETIAYVKNVGTIYDLLKLESKN
jgi:soluble lytic murein transglycosylase-like protein